LFGYWPDCAWLEYTLGFVSLEIDLIVLPRCKFKIFLNCLGSSSSSPSKSAWSLPSEHDNWFLSVNLLLSIF
jgi:hypothetical protein